jgi:predicted NUDIX family NTP pyrophosphohydrolase
MPVRASSKIQSAGPLLFRQKHKDVQVLLGHSGGPLEP